MNQSHLFCACAVTSNLLEQFKLWVSVISLFDNVDIGPQTIIFGTWNINTPDFILINHIIFLFKRYIYLRRQERHSLNIIGLKLFIKNIEIVERLIVYDKEKLSFHCKNGYCLSKRTISLHESMVYNGEISNFLWLLFKE